jgi:hypothetical protein
VVKPGVAMVGRRTVASIYSSDTRLFQAVVKQSQL